MFKFVNPINDIHEKITMFNVKLTFMQRRVEEVNVTTRERQMSIRLPVTSKETEEKTKKIKRTNEIKFSREEYLQKSRIVMRK